MKSSITKTAGAAAVALLALSGAASAEDRQFGWSVNVGGTSDYIFRGVSQTDGDPAFQAGVDFSYGILYAGIWGSNTDDAFTNSSAEIDFYAGIKPVLGPVTFDFGVIYYSYPGANPDSVLLPDLNYVELKAGYSWSALHPSLVTGTTVFWSPDYVLETGSVWTIETMAAWTLPKVHIFTPVINGVLGWQKGDANDNYFVNINGTDEEYYYWNAGLNVAVENISFDFRYWDTNIGGDAGGFICAADFLCDERFVFSAKVAVP